MLIIECSRTATMAMPRKKKLNIHKIDSSKRYRRSLCPKKLTFTALAVSLVNGGTTPDVTRRIERPNTKHVERKIGLFAPRDQL